MAHPAATSGEVRKSRCPSRAGGTGICVVRSVVMATLVLTVVGGIVGGPVGAALGAAIGRQADAAIFAPQGREGPRLADLTVQPSTYGQQIPRLFGTMRAAGRVIWAPALIVLPTKDGARTRLG